MLGLGSKSESENCMEHPAQKEKKNIQHIIFDLISVLVGWCIHIPAQIATMV